MSVISIKPGPIAIGEETSPVWASDFDIPEGLGACELRYEQQSTSIEGNVILINGHLFTFMTNQESNEEWRPEHWSKFEQWLHVGRNTIEIRSKYINPRYEYDTFKIQNLHVYSD